jgi:hypothetical protein
VKPENVVPEKIVQEEMWFIPQKVWMLETQTGTEVHAKIRGIEHRIISELRMIHGRLEPVRELQTLNLVTNEIHSWQPMPFPSQK